MGKMKPDEFKKEDGQQRAAAERAEDQVFCAQCDRKVDPVTAELAAGILKINYRELSGYTEAGWIHLLRDARGDEAVCAASVLEVLERRPTQPFDPDIFKTNPSSSNIIF